jgi:hypothetical protein
LTQVDYILIIDQHIEGVLSRVFYVFNVSATTFSLTLMDVSLMYVYTACLASQSAYSLDLYCMSIQLVLQIISQHCLLPLETLANTLHFQI